MCEWQVTVAVLAAGLVACGGGGGVEKGELGARVVEALCARDARCGVYASAEACERDQRQLGLDSRYGLGTRHDAALESGRLSYDEDAAERCVAAIRDSDCRLPAVSSDALERGIEYEPACQVLHAEQPEGECQLQAECGESAYCRMVNGSTCDGTCQPRSGEGEAAFRPVQCAPGHILSGSTGTCRRPAGEGEVCLQQGGGAIPAPCGPGLWCDEQSGTCRRTGSERDACVDWDNAPCGASFACKEGRCALRSREGESCRAPSSDSIWYSNECQSELFCDADASRLGTCRRRLGEGAACHNRLECAEGLECLDFGQEPDTRGTCQKGRGRGESCEKVSAFFSNCARGLHCSEESGTCVPSVMEGERCGPEAACMSSTCFNGRCVPFEALACR